MNFEDRRRQMVEQQLVGRGINDSAVIQAMLKVPRHKFVPDDHMDIAYDDCPVPIAEGQTISQPYIVALMIESLQLTKDDKVLEVGSGAGYQTAILSEICQQVTSIEYVPLLARQARKTIRQQGYSNVQISQGDGLVPRDYMGVKFDAVIVSAAVPKDPLHLLENLTDGGRMIVPVGSRQDQILKLISHLNGQWIEKEICHCVFVPLVGEYGWN